MTIKQYVVGLIMLIFFVISYITNILGPIVPDVITGFEISGTLAGFLPFSFFVAYGVMSIPSGLLLEKYNERLVLSLSFFMVFLGSAIISLFPNYLAASLSLFIIGSGMAVLQVAINPLLRVSAGGEHFAFYSVIAQLVFGLASYLSPGTYTYLVKSIQSEDKSAIFQFLSNHVPEHLPWVSLYWLFAIIALAMMAITYFFRYPKVELEQDERTGTKQSYFDLLKNKYVILYFFGIFAYVGSEQGIANWISQFLYEYHNIDPLEQGAEIVARFWGLLTVGCLLGLVLLKILDSRKVLILFSGAAIVSLSLALFSGASIALYAFPCTGFFLSVMWGVIFSLALNSVKEHHGSFSGILVTGIVGGAFLPAIIGILKDVLSLKAGMFILYLSLGYIFAIGFWANPLVNNKTISSAKD
ncbi:MAG: MFS transporter [Cyclobacteriaceae bacterium]